MIIRIANKNDFDKIGELMYQIFEKHLLRRPDIYTQGYSYTLEQFNKSISNKNEVLLVAETNNIIVGICHMIKQEFTNISFMQPGCIAFIEDFCVDKNYQRHGIGKTLYEAAIEKAKMWEARSLELNVWEVNEEARKFYDAVGFSPKSTRMELHIR